MSRKEILVEQGLYDLTRRIEETQIIHDKVMVKLQKAGMESSLASYMYKKMYLLEYLSNLLGELSKETGIDSKTQKVLLSKRAILLKRFNKLLNNIKTRISDMQIMSQQHYDEYFLHAERPKLKSSDVEKIKNGSSPIVIDKDVVYKTKDANEFTSPIDAALVSEKKASENKYKTRLENLTLPYNKASKYPNISAEYRWYSSFEIEQATGMVRKYYSTPNIYSIAEELKDLIMKLNACKKSLVIYPRIAHVLEKTSEFQGDQDIKSKIEQDMNSINSKIAEIKKQISFYQETLNKKKKKIGSIDGDIASHKVI